MIKLSDKLKKDLDCICGICEHEVYDKVCLYNKILESDNPGEVQKKLILKLMEEAVKLNNIKTDSGGKIKAKEANGTNKK